ncbi:MAG: transglycosylase SLT domain-containing protein [Spirochaetaceae bacterium]|nr:transglycosylase SLT domain-containing protein [Spirochaetaceae bacterium]
MKVGSVFPTVIALTFIWLFTVAGKVEPKTEQIGETREDTSLSPAEAYRSILSAPPANTDIILEAYRNAVLKDTVVEFFTSLAGSGEIASVILSGASTFNISPSLAFALCWEESQFDIWAVNRKNQNASVDRGLFQLNCCSFPTLREAEFFNPRLNAHYGMAHLRWCMDTGGSDVTALAMYNAGTDRVSTGRTPKTTLDYISRIVKTRNAIEEKFKNECIRGWNAAELEDGPREPVNAGKNRNFFHFILTAAPRR